MASKKDTKNLVELNVPYEQNQIQLKGIFGFTIGLLLLIIFTFLLMFGLINVLDDYFKADTTNPLAMSDKERLPPEPRLQSAPGFGVDSEKGRVNMELGIPQAEWIEVRKQWDELLLKGRKDEKTGVMSVMPIDEAKSRFLQQSVKARSGADAEATMKMSREFYSDASSGRVASEKRR